MRHRRPRVLLELGARALERHAAAAQVTGDGSLFQIHWTRHPLVDARGVNTANDELKLLTFLGLGNLGVQTSMRGMCALSTPMTREHVDTLAAALDEVIVAMTQEGWPVHG